MRQIRIAYKEVRRIEANQKQLALDMQAAQEKLIQAIDGPEVVSEAVHAAAERYETDISQVECFI